MNEIILYHASKRWLESPINSKRARYWERVYQNAKKKIERGRHV